LGNYAEGIAMPTVYNPTLDRPEMKSFLQEYEKQYGTQPDFWAIQGYETVKILAHAMEAAGSAMPEQIAAALSKIECYKGVQGDLTCNSKGEIVGSKIYVKIVEQGEFHYVGKY
jgi:branched-chain amino acid transport system substrate-binding protein